jgi:hypothetical protein
MVTTSRKFERIICSRAGASPFLIFAASSISSSGVKRGIRPISRRYLFNPLSLPFMTGMYLLEWTCRYCARVGFCGATYELMLVPSFERGDLFLAELESCASSNRNERFFHFLVSASEQARSSNPIITAQNGRIHVPGRRVVLRSMIPNSLDLRELGPPLLWVQL